jgi:serine/threonine protein kinase
VPKVCASCGGTLGADDRFCTLCGHAVQDARSVTDPTQGGAAQPLLLERVRSATRGLLDVRGQIGVGRKGTVYLATDVRLQRPVALRVTARGLPFEDAVVDRLARQCKAWLALDHPNILKVYSVTETDGLLLIAMQYVDESLDRLLERLGPADVDVAQFVLSQIADALEFAHQRGVVHGALNPGDVRIDRDGTPLVSDFGVAHAAESSTATMTGAIVGGTTYMSPEQLLGSDTVPASDQYALGILADQLLTGATPFVGSSLEVANAHLMQRPPSPREVRPGVPVWLSDVVMRMLEKTPEARWPSLDAVAEAIQAGAIYDEPSIRHRLTEIRSRPVTPAPRTAEPAERRPDEVQFTVYRPKTVRPNVWYPLLAFAHLADRRPSAPADEPDPIDQVREQAAQFLGSKAKAFSDNTVDARQAVPHEGEITLVPVVEGIEFNPERRVFRWLEDVHREEFRLRADPQLDGRTARGRVSAYFGAILVAEIDLAIRVDAAGAAADTAPTETTSARPYRKIFASYSHKDTEIVRQYERFVGALGDQYLRDVRDLRAGELWDDALMRLIDEADVFQLFWSTNSMRSSAVRREWEHALTLNRASFIRPTYWQDPLPEAQDAGLPPDTLRRLHFARISVDVPSMDGPTRETNLGQYVGGEQPPFAPTPPAALPMPQQASRSAPTRGLDRGVAKPKPREASAVAPSTGPDVPPTAVEIAREAAPARPQRPETTRTGSPMLDQILSSPSSARGPSSPARLTVALTIALVLGVLALVWYFAGR